MNIIQILTPVLNAILIGILGFISKEVVKVVQKVIDLIIAKIGLTNYQKLQVFSKDAWKQVYRLNPIIGDTIRAKQTMFESLIKQKMPGITDAEIISIRQSIAGEYNNKPAVVQTIEQPVEEVPVTPIIKYVAPDGTELKPVNNTTA